MNTMERLRSTLPTIWFAALLAVCFFAAAATTHAQTVFLTADDTTVPEGTAVSLQWFVEDAGSCTLTDVGSVSGSGSSAVTPTAADTTYTLSCDAGTDAVTVNLKPKVTIAPSATSATRNGSGEVNLDVTYNATYADSCGPLIINQPGGASAIIDSSTNQPTSGTRSIPSFYFPENGTYSFRTTCTNNGYDTTVTSASVNVTGTVVIAAPSCPIASADGVTVVEFPSTKKLMGYGAGQPYRGITGSEAVSLEPGKYKIRMISWDGSDDRDTDYQPNEQWKIAFLDTLNPPTETSNIVTESTPTPDLEDYVLQTTQDVVTDNAFTVPAGIVAIRGRHINHADPTWPIPSSGSVDPVCVSFTKVDDDEPADPVEPTPDPSDVDLVPVIDGTEEGGNPVTVDGDETITLEWESVNTDTCYSSSGDGFSTNGGLTDGTDSVPMPAAGSSETYTIQCSGPGGNSTDSVTIERPGGSVDLIVSQTIVNGGEDVELTWNLNGNDPSACTLTGPGLSGVDLTAQTSVSVTITGESNFTLNCNANTISPETGMPINTASSDSEAVRINPEFIET